MYQSSFSKNGYIQLNSIISKVESKKFNNFLKKKFKINRKIFISEKIFLMQK